MSRLFDPFMADVRPSGIQKGRGGFWRSADDAPYVSDPDGNVCATGARKGEVKRLKYGSPSGVGRLIENDVGLTKYKQRNTLLGIGMNADLAEACRDLVLLDADSDEFRKAADTIVVEADNLTRSWLAADRGSHGHAICEMRDKGDWPPEIYSAPWIALQFIAAGEALGIDPLTQMTVADSWAHMLRLNGLEILAIEAPCVDDKWRLAGTLDRIVRLTRDLRFAMPGGEIVDVPADTVLVLDIKFGKPRRAHLIQIASYAQSLPYDTDAETRSQWSWPIDQQHALIAHGDFGGDGRPVTIELLWVDLVAGREHGGACVVAAKQWSSRDDLWSVAQLNAPVEVVACRDADTVAVGVDEASAGLPIPAVPESAKAIRLPTPDSGTPSQDVGDTAGMTPQFVSEPEVASIPVTGSDTPSQGADLSDPEYELLWAKIRHEHDALLPGQREWVNRLSREAMQANCSFHTRSVQTERSYHLCKALVTLAAGGADDEILEVLVEQIALTGRYKNLGHNVGSLNHHQAERLATLADQWAAPPPDTAA